MKQGLWVILFVLHIQTCMAQFFPENTLNVRLDAENKTLYVEQEIIFVNTSPQALDTLQLNDWANAYSSTESPLAKRLVEEFNRSFYLSSKNKRGATTLHALRVNQDSVRWWRPERHIDRINVFPNRAIQPNQSIRISLEYTVQLPDAKFTGYGILDKNNFFLDNFFITLARREKNSWSTFSHLDVEDVPQQSANYLVHFEIPGDLNIESNLRKFKTVQSSSSTLYSFSASQQKRLLFFIGQKDKYEQFTLPSGLNIKTNLTAEQLSVNAKQYSLNKIEQYLSPYFGTYPHSTLILAQEKYDKRPFYGLTLIPQIFKPFPLQFEYEIRALNTLLYDYLNEMLQVHPRRDYWLLGGLHSYLMINYVKTFYPDSELFGLIMRQPIAKFFLNKYHFTDLTFEEAYMEFHEFTIRRNLQQALQTPKEELIKFNEQIGTPSQMGILLNFLQESATGDIKNFVDKIKDGSPSSEKILSIFHETFNTQSIAKFDQYFNQRQSLDFSFSSFQRTKDSLKIRVSEKSNIAFPFALGWVKKDSIIHIEKKEGSQMNSLLSLPKLEADYLVINPVTKLPEFNPRNNWRKINGMGVKPLRLTFVKDLENPKYNQIFYNPRMNFNAYDGLLFGVRLNNKTIKSRPFKFTLQPFYATLVKKIVGSAALSYTRYNEHEDWYLKNMILSGSTFHYDSNLRYAIVRGSLHLLKRDNTHLRDNAKTAVSLFGQYVNREENKNQSENPNYVIGGINYTYANKGALKYTTVNGKFEASSAGFGKAQMINDFRYLLPSGRQISLRAYAGAFLWRKASTSSYFDFALDRPNDYLFEYNYFGRSETQGVYSQQFIPAEGGFKSKFENPYANQYMVTLNTGVGLWKWIEAYADIGWYKNQNRSVIMQYDSGLRLNLVPDFLELYFPIYNTTGWQISPHNYAQKIRYVLVLEPTTLAQLFSRKWF